MSHGNQSPHLTVEGAPEQLGAALAYALSGLLVFPLHTPRPDGGCSCDQGSACKSVGKHPRTRNGLKDATADEAQVRTWWTTWPDANIGIACGSRSGIVVLDIDGPQGEESLRRMTDAHGALPATRTIKTGKGRQMYFQHPGGRVKSRAPFSADLPGLDSRGDGGYVVAPPSLHANGSRYATDALAPYAVAAAPGWLIDLFNGGPNSPNSSTGAAAANGDSFAEGGRNSSLMSVAGRMRYAGASQEEIEVALLAFNEARCRPPLDASEVVGIARSAANYAPGSPDDVRRTLTDVGNAKRFAKLYGDAVRYVPERGTWLLWRGTHWETDATGEVTEMAKAAAAAIYDEVQLVSDQGLREDIAKHAKASANVARIKAMLELAATEPNLVVRESELDSHRGWLAVGNGTLRLGTGELRDSAPQDYITKRAPVSLDPLAECPTFLSFLDRIMGADTELIEYLQRVMGYALSGYTDESVLFFLYGTGANGKSTLLNVVRGLLGPEHCKTLPSEAIAARKATVGPTPELARLPGARVVLTSEVEEGSFLAESQVKQMTGGDAMMARHLYGAPFEFVPQFKLFVAGNHKPVVRGTDHGIWRRIHLVPFTVTIPPDERDPELARKLEAELPGILNWALEGYRAWRTRKLSPPPCVLEAVEEYRTDMDILGQWVEDKCETGDALDVGATEAYLDYSVWAIANGYRPWTMAAFGRSMQERYGRRRTAAGQRYVGLRLKPGPLGSLRSGA